MNKQDRAAFGWCAWVFLALLYYAFGGASTEAWLASVWVLAMYAAPILVCVAAITFLVKGFQK